MLEEKLDRLSDTCVILAERIEQLQLTLLTVTAPPGGLPPATPARGLSPRRPIQIGARARHASRIWYPTPCWRWGTPGARLPAAAALRGVVRSAHGLPWQGRYRG